MRDKLKLYDILTAEELDGLCVLSTGIPLAQQLNKEIKTPELYGDFVIVNEYYFKQTYGSYQLMKTPTETHKPQKCRVIKQAPNDRYKK